MPGDLQSPYSIDMPAAAWVLGIANHKWLKDYFRHVAL